MNEVAPPSRWRLGPPYTAPEAQGATFVELFFDLVFVFALTEVIALTLEHLDWSGAPRRVVDRRGLLFAGVDRTADVVRVAIGAVVVRCLLWWTYFGWLKEALELRLEREPSNTEGKLARDAYSLLHFPLIGGVIDIAIGFEEMVLHPDEHLETAGLVALTLGLVLFIGSGVAAWRRAGKQLLLPRVAVLAALVVALVLAQDARPPVVLAIVAVGVATIALIEQLRNPMHHLAEAN
jgi:low temperature requirement protein LtrA